MSTPLWLARHLRTPCTIVRRIPNGTDEYGNVSYDEEPHDAMCFLGPLSEVETQGGRAEVSLHLLVLDSGTASLVDGFCSFLIGGAVFEAIGPAQAPEALHTPGTHHVQFTVQRSTA
jgi:hypothetical protein